jgi:hypothetical protein
MPISQRSLLSEHNEGNVRLFFFATMFCFLSLVISIVAGTENFNYRLVGVLCGIAIVFLILGFRVAASPTISGIAPVWNSAG